MNAPTDGTPPRRPPTSPHAQTCIHIHKGVRGRDGVNVITMTQLARYMCAAADGGNIPRESLLRLETRGKDSALCDHTHMNTHAQRAFTKPVLNSTRAAAAERPRAPPAEFRAYLSLAVPFSAPPPPGPCCVDTTVCPTAHTVSPDAVLVNLVQVQRTKIARRTCTACGRGSPASSSRRPPQLLRYAEAFARSRGSAWRMGRRTRAPRLCTPTHFQARQRFYSRMVASARDEAMDASQASRDR